MAHPDSFAHPDSEELRSFAVGAVDDSRWNEIERHLAACESCRWQVQTASDDELIDLIRRAEAPHTNSNLPARLQPGFEILEEIGRGGMAIVFRARHVGLNRMIALKRLRDGVDASADDLARFRREAEVVSQLQHPHIVQIYEVGEQDGIPFLALELVDGGSLSERLARGPLSARAAAHVVERVARALHVAHEKQILHRDLKPSNILLSTTMQGLETSSDQGESLHPKISDFGLAKQLGSSHERTRTGEVLGTPSYMAPELALGMGAESRASEVYALGTILYESLTGIPPFRAASTAETLRLVTTTEPVSPRRIQPSVPRDLETICLRCLNKDGARRFASALDLADDLQKFLDGRAIASRPTGILERATLWTRRRPLTAALIGFISLALTTMTCGGWFMNLRLNELATKANRNYDHAIDAIDVMLRELGTTKLADIPETESLRFEMLTIAKTRLEQLRLEEPKPNLRTLTGYARVLTNIAALHLARSEPHEAERLLDQADQLIDSIPSEMSTHEEFMRLQVEARTWRVELQRFRGQFKEALRLHLESIDQLERVSSGSLSDRMQLHQAYSILWGLRSQTSTDIDPQTTLEKLLRQSAEMLRDFPNEIRAHLAQAMSLHNAGMHRYSLRQFAEAEASFREALQEWQFCARADRIPRRWHSNMTQTYASLAMVCNDSNRKDEAIDLLQRAIAIHTELIRQFPDATEYPESVAQMWHNLGLIALSRSQWQDAERSFLEAIRIREEALKSHATDQVVAFRLAEDLVGISVIYRTRQEVEPAFAALRRAIDLQEAAHSSESTHFEHQISLANTYGNYADSLKAHGQNEEALEYVTRAIQLLRDVAPGTSAAHSALWQLHGVRAQILTLLGRSQEALTDLDRAVELSEGSTRITWIINRCLVRVATGAKEQAMNEATEILAQSNLDGVQLYNLACVFSLLARAQLETSDNSPTSNASAEECTRQAILALQRPQVLAHFSAPVLTQQISGDPDLIELKDHPEFRRWVESLPLSEP